VDQTVASSGLAARRLRVDPQLLADAPVDVAAGVAGSALASKASKIFSLSSSNLAEGGFGLVRRGVTKMSEAPGGWAID
jgi:hypothetical protein